MALTGVEYVNSSTKRSLDISGSLLLGAAVSPALVATALETCIEHRTLHPLFIQPRIGKNGEEFNTYKFQSLRNHLPQLHMGGTHHPHASSIGRLIRASSLDELPQIANVLKGDMSLVGIRPMPPATLVAYSEAVEDDELYNEWLACYKQNPGLTGEGQLFAKGFAEHEAPGVARQRMEIDIESFYNASLANDLRTLGRTPLVVLQATGQLNFSVA